ncbi:HDIG domain-containing protein [candidate division KSB1 bacterium]|nr:HDIG domain-containing protein [candidate division KSB1 bacterium]
MDRQQAFTLVESKIANRNLLKHVLAVEAVMRKLARSFSQDEAEWGLAGLLHDLDYEETANTPEQHTLITERLLQSYAVKPEIVHAIKCHNGLAPRLSKMDQALYAVDPVTGLIVAAALMHPEKKLAALDVDFILRRYKVKSFARGANREQIETCGDLGLDLPSFLAIALLAMQEIHSELGL